MSTSTKHRLFTKEPMVNKSVKDLPGVGESSGTRLQQSGYSKAADLHRVYETYNNDKPGFQSFMKDTCNSSSKNSGACYDAFKAWDQRYGN